jgi:2'-5' RNA ligase
MYYRRRLSLMTILEDIAEDNKKNGKMIAIFIPPNVGGSLQKVFEDMSGDKVLPEDMHITLGLLYGGEDETRKILPILRDLSESIDEFDIKIEKFGKFPPNEHNHNKHVLWAKPSSDSLKDIHDMIFSALEKHGIKIDNGSFPFNPHITLKYCDQDPDISRKLADPVFRIKNVSVASKGTNHHIRLRGPT